MFTLNERINNLLFLARNKTKNFFYGTSYPVIFSLITLLFWFANLELVGFTIVCLTACFVFVVFDDLAPAIPVFFLTSMTFRNPSMMSTNAYPVVLFAIMGCTIIFNVIKYPIKKFKFDLVSIAILALLISMLLGGIFSPFMSDFTQGLSMISISGISALVVHTLLNNKMHLGQKRNLKKYFCFSFLCAINVACCQLIFALAYNKLIIAPGFTFPGFCWANTNHIGNMILLAIPLCCYIITTEKNIGFYLFELVFLYASMYISGSDGGLVTLLVFTPAIIIETHLRISSKNYKLFKYFWLIIVCVFLLFLTYFITFHFYEFTQFIKRVSADNGRRPIYIQALELFKNFPIFGVSMGHASVAVGSYHNGYFHSTFFHIIASCGIVGLGAFAFLYFARINRLIKSKSSITIFAMIIFIMFAVYGMIENSEYNIVLIYLTPIITVCGFKDNAAEENPLPLSRKFYNIIF